MRGSPLCRYVSREPCDRIAVQPVHADAGDHRRARSVFPPRVVATLHAHGNQTLAELTVQIPRRRRRRAAIAGLGVAGACRVATARQLTVDLISRAKRIVRTVGNESYFAREVEFDSRSCSISANC